MSSQTEKTTEQKILETAVTLLTSHGDSFTMEQLVAQTGLSRATIYRRVGNKATLLQRLADERGLDIQALSQPNMRERILAAARTVFGRYGLLRPTMEQIAQEAGVGVATLYRHFGDRNSLIQAFAERIPPNVAVQQKMISPDASFEQMLYQLAETAVTFMYEHRDMIRHTIASYSEEITLFKEVRTFQEQSAHLLAQFLQMQMDAGHLKQADPLELAFSIIGMMFAFTVMRPTFYDIHITDAAETAKFIVDLFLTGARHSVK